MAQELTFLVPANYTLPTIFQELDPVSTGQALTLGAYAYQIMKQEGYRISNEALFLKIQKEAEAKFEEQVTALQTSSNKTNEQLKVYKERLGEEQERRLDTERRIREEEKRNRDEIMKEKELRIKSLEDQNRALDKSIRDSSRALTEQFQNFKEQILKTNSNSKKKGDQGEAIFQAIVQRAFGNGSIGEDFNLENIGQEGHQGDLHMKWKSTKALLEVKNYDRNIDGKEVTKFLRDMEQGKDCQFGIMISLYTGITNHTKAGDVDIEILRDGRLCVYLTRFMHHEDPTLFLQSLIPFLEVYLKMSSAVQPSLDDEDTQLKRLIETFEQQRGMILRVVKSHDEQTRKMKLVLTNAKKKQEQSWTEIMGEMRECEHRVKLLLETILSDSSTPELNLPDYVFVNTDQSMYNEKERKFLSDILEAFEFDDEYRMTTMEAKDIFKKLGYNEDRLAELRPKVFHEDVWPKGKKEIKYLRPKKS